MDAVDLEEALKKALEREREKAKEKGPFLLIAGLYAAVVTVGFHNEAPPLAPTSLLIVPLTLITFTHLLNVFQVALLLKAYPKRAFTLDLVSFGVLALMFRLLVRPAFGGLGTLLPPWTHGSFVRDFIEHKPFDELATYGIALHRFFWLGLALLGLYVGWHVATARWLKRQEITLERQWLYAFGWAAWALQCVIGIILSGGRPGSEAEWDRAFNSISILAVIAALSSGLFIVLVVCLDASYYQRPRPSGRASKAYVFVKATLGKSLDVVQQLRKIDGITRADLCVGSPDIIAIAESGDEQTLQRMVLSQIQQTQHVIDTDTHAVAVV